ncbi:EAL domain-containing response regulator [Aliiglaciecola lipolytica]|uniref:EAL domain-containing response regulator n=1 Tax=Aliiglaciecola lipolytica TaxID=477689 RepID=UPI001C097868|nr:EAL domain-containing protein [Aliiglaciecola lipolytica]MBU2879197.1 EAL domain-containing protein [Aliiglaciecola lipolytica]
MSTALQRYLSETPAELCNLLVIDDEESNLKAISRTFRRTKYQVFTATSAKEGLELLTQHDFQVVLSDFRMPDIDGGTLVKNIKQCFPNIISMILTGYADFDAAVDVMNSGAAYKFLTKPWNNQLLIENVEQAFKEYHQRLLKMSKEKLNAQYIKPDRIRLDSTIKFLLDQEAQFALASVIISDISLHDQYWAKRGEQQLLGLESVINNIQACLPNNCEIFEVDVDQVLIIIPESECDTELHNKITLLSGALSACSQNDLNIPKLQCNLSYALAPFSDMDTQQLLHSIRNLPEQDFHESKHHGQKPCVVKLDAIYVAKKKRKKTIQNSIQQAINSDQFSLYFQPKVRLSDGMVETAEVLMRWQHSSLGWVSPVEFISLSELDGQIEKIGSWLLKNSINQLIGLQKQYGNNIKLAINVSPRQLQNNRLVEELTYLLGKTGLNPASLELEITEGCIIDDLTQTSEILWKLKKLGVNIAIDDFGSGYTSFAYLTKLPVDVLKLDKILIDDLGINSDVSEMVQSVIELCKKMQIEVVAEGVEDERQVKILRDFDCDYIQGYVYSKPVAKPEFEKTLINQPFKVADKAN